MRAAVAATVFMVNESVGEQEPKQRGNSDEGGW